MRKKNFAFWLIVSACAVVGYACDDDGDQITIKECVDGSTCASGKCLADFTCAKIVKKGENRYGKSWNF